MIQIHLIRVLKIHHDSVVDGEGLRTVIFFAGCPHLPHCKGCHNPESWDLYGGTLMTTEEILEEIKSNPLITGVTFSGGEPFYQAYRIITLAKEIKNLGLNIWCYTGYRIETLLEEEGFTKRKRLLRLVDVLVDGRFIEAEKDLTLPFRGSRNQRILRNGIDFFSKKRTCSVCGTTETKIRKHRRDGRFYCETHYNYIMNHRHKLREKDALEKLWQDIKI